MKLETKCQRLPRKRMILTWLTADSWIIGIYQNGLIQQQTQIWELVHLGSCVQRVSSKNGTDPVSTCGSALSEACQKRSSVTVEFAAGSKIYLIRSRWSKEGLFQWFDTLA